MLFVIEGLDGAGKSTQVRWLKQYLEERLGALEYIHFPRYDAPVYGELIGKFLRGGFGTLDAVHPQLVALLYAEDRHGAAPQMRASLQAGRALLLDRYVYSNIAYQCAKLDRQEEREQLREWIINTEFGAFDLPRPDLNLFLDVPIGFVEQKLSAQRQGSDRAYLEGSRDIHEADIRFQMRVREVYLRQCEVDPRFLRIDCAAADGSMLPPDAIFEKIQQAVDGVLSLS
ncbi:MAG: thymidylate kinase [Bacteroidales bacterium]|nr:thymidylate kinase [Bacteroidales bacterium]